MNRHRAKQINRCQEFTPKGMLFAQVLEEVYVRQNADNPNAPQVVFFRDAVEHIARAARVFRQPGGHLLTVGAN